MRQITIESVEKAIDKIDGLDDDRLDEVIEQIANEQPNLMAYVMSSLDEFESETLEGYIIYYFSLFVESFKNEGVTLKEIDEETLQAFDEEYEQILNDFFESEDDDLIEEFTRQPFLCKFLAIELSEEDEDGSTLSDEEANQMYVIGLAMIALLNRAIVA